MLRSVAVDQPRERSRIDVTTGDRGSVVPASNAGGGQSDSNGRASNSGLGPSNSGGGRV